MIKCGYYTSENCPQPDTCCLACDRQDDCTSRCIEYDAVEYAVDCWHAVED